MQRQTPTEVEKRRARQFALALGNYSRNKQTVKQQDAQTMQNRDSYVKLMQAQQANEEALAAMGLMGARKQEATSGYAQRMGEQNQKRIEALARQDGSGVRALESSFGLGRQSSVVRQPSGAGGKVVSEQERPPAKQKQWPAWFWRKQRNQ